VLARSTFDETFFGVPCYRLHQPITDRDLDELAASGRTAAVFADAKVLADDLDSARVLLDFGFRKICTQVELRHGLALPTRTSRPVPIENTLKLSNDQTLRHASNFEVNRFRLDPLVERNVADALYAEWIRNSLSGAKRVAHIGENFCTFSDANVTRSIDLLSVLEKRRGFARCMLEAVLRDARESGLSVVRVVTETENTGALAVYRRVGFEIDHFMNVFHLYRAK